MHWFFIVLLVILALALTALLTEYGIFLSLLGRPKRSTRVPKFYEDSPHYKVSRAGMALMKTLPCEDKYRTSPDGLKLHAYFFPTEEKPKKFVLGIHGYKSYARPEFGPYIQWYQSLGYSLLLPDDRAHAPSEGKYIGFGVLDRLDCVDWANWIVENYGSDVEILIHGVSMGGATVLAASAEDALPGQVMGIVSDCGYTAAWEILTCQLRDTFHIPPVLVLPAAEKFCKALAGYDFHSFTPIEQVKKAKVPILFVHGTEDKMVPYFMVDKLYEVCASRKAKFVVEGAGHAESIALDPEGYHRAVRDFFHI